MQKKESDNYFFENIDYEHLFEAMINSTDDFFWSLDNDYCFLAFNENFREYFLNKFSVEIKTGDNFLALIPYKDVEYWKNHSDLALAGKKFTDKYSFEFGDNCDFGVHFNPIKNSYGVITGLSIAAQKIQNEISAEEKFIKSELLSESILATSPDGIVTTELDGTISFASDKFVEMVESSTVENLFGKKLSEFIFDEDQQMFSEYLRNILDGGHLSSCTFRLNKNNGTVFHVESNIDVIKNDNGRPILVLFILRDISERILAEIEREKILQDIAYSRDQIEQEAGKYVELNNQLAESEYKLQQLNSSKDKLFSIIGHDLKNPIFIMLGTSQIIEEDYNELTDTEKKELIKIIYDTAANTQKLLEDLLCWSRAQSDLIQVNHESLSLKNIIKENLKLVNTQAENKKITLKVNANSTLLVYADKNLLSTVIRNLLTNAVKFTPEGGAVSVNAVGDGTFVQMSVEDTGIGLSNDDMKKLFRIDVNNKEIGHSREKGTGLGLILCKEFCEKQGGKIWVESEVNKGSKFYITIPIYKVN